MFGCKNVARASTNYTGFFTNSRSISRSGWRLGLLIMALLYNYMVSHTFVQHNTRYLYPIYLPACLRTQYLSSLCLNASALKHISYLIDQITIISWWRFVFFFCVNIKNDKYVLNHVLFYGWLISAKTNFYYSINVFYSSSDGRPKLKKKRYYQPYVSV